LLQPESKNIRETRKDLQTTSMTFKREFGQGQMNGVAKLTELQTFKTTTYLEGCEQFLE
jgi:hypothetical protein